MSFRSLAVFSYTTMFALVGCMTEPACVDECPAGAFTLGSCPDFDTECTTYAMCSGDGEVSCSTSCNAAPSPRCPSDSESIGSTAAGFPSLNSRVVNGCGGEVVYCAPCETAEVCPSGEVPDYTVQRELAEHYECGVGGFVCIPFEECLSCGDFAVEVESCAPEADCTERLCGEETIACTPAPSCDDVDACGDSASPVLGSGVGECPADAAHCVAPPCRGERSYCETACHPQARAVDDVTLCGDENCSFVDVGDERIWCAGEPASCGAIPLCDEGDTTIERDASCSEGATCYYRSLCGQVIQCQVP